jgi:hypothetical protein
VAICRPLVFGGELKGFLCVDDVDFFVALGLRSRLTTGWLRLRGFDGFVCCDDVDSAFFLTPDLFLFSPKENDVSVSFFPGLLSLSHRSELHSACTLLSLSLKSMIWSR